MPPYNDPWNLHTGRIEADRMLIAYTRISTDDKGQTVANQLHAIMAQHEVKIAFSDEVSGSTNPNDREGFKRLLSVVKRGDAIVISALDRLSRDTLDTLKTIKDLYALGVAVISVRESDIDTRTAQGELQATMFSAFAAYERKLISERTKQALQRLKDEGKQLGRPQADGHEKALEMFRAGSTVPEVMAATGLSRATTYRIKAAA